MHLPGRTERRSLAFWCACALAGWCSLGLAAKWTVMVYMAADNGMSDQSYIDLQEMAAVGSTPDVNVVVQVDHPATDSWPLPRRLRVEKNSLLLLDELPELDMADPATLADFVRFGKDQYPAENYLLVLWDHGNGWQAVERQVRGGAEPGESRDVEQPVGPKLPEPLDRGSSFLYDQSSGNAMSVAEGKLNTAMAGVREALGRKIPVLAFDACLMQMLEVMYEVRDAAVICVGTEDLMPFNGFPYQEFLDLLVRRPTLSPRAYASALPQLFANAYNQGSQGDEDVTLSAVDLTGIGAAVGQLDNLLGRVRPSASEPSFRNQRDAVQTFSCENVPPGPRDDNIDLIDWLRLMPVASGSEALLPDAMSRFEKMVIACAVNGATLARSRGIACWFPDNYLALKYNARDYHQLTFARENSWLYLLDCFFHADDVKPTPVTRVERQPDRIGQHNDFRLRWESAYDMAPVSYEVREIASPTSVFNDPGENLDQWISDGFTLSNSRSYSGNYSLYSGLGNDLESMLTLLAPLALPRGGLLSFFAWYNTNETMDTTGAIHRDVCYVETTTDTLSWTTLDSLYGANGTWQECRYFLPDAGARWVRFRFKTGTGSHMTGVYIDNVEAWSFGDWRQVTPGIRDSSFSVFNALRDAFHYAVVPRDSFGNVGFVSPLLRVAVPNYAEPYSLPGPIVGDTAVLVCDFPGDETPDVLVYTLSGELVRKFPSVIGQRIGWNTRNEIGKALGSGLYLVVVKGKRFKSIGRIAIAR